ncbi:MAG TPA: spondin domain-containing protein [Vicinamibacteria bacterium]|nr:spondin domain-containing protein [Vicinamibacteria bacterium]
MPKRSLALVFAVLGAAACDSTSPAAPTTTTTIPAPVAAPVALYRLTFESTWTAASHPSDPPRNPHFSRLIGGTHRSSVSFWEPGGMASEGIRLMAERGRTIPLDMEVEAAIAAGHAQRLLVGGAIDFSPDSIGLDFEINREYSLVTIVSMVAPSPDWFVGVSGLNLIENGDWVALKVVELQPWDAGTDSGITFTSADERTVPPVPIQRIDGWPFQVGSSVPPLGTFSFRRLN